MHDAFEHKADAFNPAAALVEALMHGDLDAVKRKMAFGKDQATRDGAMQNHGMTAQFVGSKNPGLADTMPERHDPGTTERTAIIIQE